MSEIKLSRPLIGEDPALQKVLRLVGKVAPTDSSVLVLGESGTGKELIARAIHEMSPRASKPMIPINCGKMRVPDLPGLGIECDEGKLKHYSIQ